MSIILLCFCVNLSLPVQVEALLSQMDAVNQKYRAAVCEADVLRQCLGDARSDSSRLHRESELVVTNVNQWVKEQK